MAKSGSEVTANTFSGQVVQPKLAVAGGQHERQEPDGHDRIADADQPAVERRVQPAGGKCEHEMDRGHDEQVLEQ